ncbi:MAG: (2Fe-2S)-binding protein [Planctomycetaceae bacterium]|nr:(2Fe-2S)-binding protein [Planctomycetaceae bacterium]
MELDDQVCYCFHVSKRKILNYIRLHHPRRASQISECGGAGTGCGWCVPYLQRYFRESQQEQISEPELTPAEYEAKRAEYIKARKGQSSSEDEETAASE